MFSRKLEAFARLNPADGYLALQITAWDDNSWLNEISNLNMLAPE